jgi:hypothetical protein
MGSPRGIGPTFSFVLGCSAWARLEAGLLADLGEEGGEAVVVFLAPFLVWVMVALRTLQTHAEEDLGHVLKLFLTLVHGAKPGDCRIVTDLTSCGYDATDKLIKGQVLV